MLLLTGAFLNVSANGLAQTTVSFSGKNVPLVKVFTAITEQTGFSVAYSINILDNDLTVSVDAVNQPMKEFLEDVFERTPLKWSIKNTTIFVSRKAAANSERQTKTTAPPLEIKGRVETETGEALTGVSVMIKGSNKGTVTDNNGQFSLRVEQQKIEACIFLYRL